VELNPHPIREHAPRTTWAESAGPGTAVDTHPSVTASLLVNDANRSVASSVNACKMQTHVHTLGLALDQRDKCRVACAQGASYLVGEL